MKGRFIGRQSELKQIREWIEHGPDRLLVSLFGEGGVGKTSLATALIQEEAQWATTSYEAVLVDFDLPQNRALAALREKISRTFSEKSAKDYREAVRYLEDLEAHQVSWL